MQDLVNSLNKRRKITMYIVVLFALLSLFVSYNFKISPLHYFDGKYNLYFIYGLIIYKLFELIILYYILFHRHLIRIRSKTYKINEFLKLKKHAKLLLFLIPQGNTIFGIIAYKLSGSVLLFLIFLAIALITLILVRPEKLLVSDKFPNLN
ncbi:MAG: hypothetical protein H8E76_05320 [Helicobacteraceae bacterium]|nr:hypothetical protein [Candidatus Sulfurimonas ponti]